MTREEVSNEILNLDKKHLLTILPTGYGKSKIALNYINKINPEKVLIVIPLNTLISNWKQEIAKWGYNYNNIVFSTYRSLHKHIDTWDAVIFDECHHLSERAAESLEYIKAERMIFLSATVKKEILYRLEDIFFDLKVYKIRLREAINNEVLPDPIIILHKLQLGNDKSSFVIHPKVKGTMLQGNIKNYWYLNKIKSNPITITCTQKEHIEWLNSQINYWKNKFFMNNQPYMKNKWLQLCSERLKVLSQFKEKIVKEQLNTTFKNVRTLTFCSSIAQTSFMGEYCLHSNNSKTINDDILESFNSGKINHITACAMLDEGQNLVNCQFGIYTNLSASDRLIIQRLGRLLRHKNPYVYLPYFENTRDEEIINKMTQDINSNNIITYEKFNESKSIATT